MRKQNKADLQESSQTSATAVLDQVNWREVKSGLHLIPLELVAESPENARINFDQAELQSLANSIKEDGGVNAIAVKVHPLTFSGEQIPELCPLFELTDGARRYRALQLNGAKFIKAEVEQIENKDEAFRKSVICNFHRVDLDPIEKSNAFQKLMDSNRYGSIRALAKSLGMPEHERSFGDLLSLQKLFPGARKALTEKRITQSHAVLIARESIHQQPMVLEACFRPEAIENGGKTEMVPVLISEKQLRQWIADNLHKPEPAQPSMFGGETEAEKADAAEQASLEEKADEILEDNPEISDPETRQHYDNESTSDSVPAAKPSSKDDGDLDDDDLAPDQRAAVKPEEATAYEKEEERRVKLLTEICAEALGNVDVRNNIAREIVRRALRKMSQAQFDLFRKITNSRSDYRTPASFETYLAGIQIDNIANNIHQDLVAVLLLGDLSPNTPSHPLEFIHAIISMPQEESPAAEKRSGKGKKPSEPSATNSGPVLTDKQIEGAVELALTSVEDAQQRWGFRSGMGLTNKELANEITRELFEGGNFVGDGVKVSWRGGKNGSITITNSAGNAIKVVEGKDLIALARKIFDVGDRKPAAAKPKGEKNGKVKIADAIAKNKPKADKSVKAALKKNKPKKR